jgi:hypothetical protein
MKKIFYLLLLILFSSSCIAQSKNRKEKGVGSPQKTANPNTPYIYKNGYLNYTILKIPVIQKKDTTNLNELKFNAVFSAMYTKKVMYDKFGKWTKEVRPNDNDRHPILVWENIKLFDDENKLFSVYANGDENWNEIYASVLVFDESNMDCLNDTSLNRAKIIEYFSNGIKGLNEDQDFYDVYWKSVNSYTAKNK